MKETRTKGTGMKRKRQLPDSVKALRRPRSERLFYAHEEEGNKIVNIPLNTKTGEPNFSKAEVEDYGKIYKGWHRLRKVVIQDNKDNLFLRMVLE
jgi:hypothetical protein